MTYSISNHQDYTNIHTLQIDINDLQIDKHEIELSLGYKENNIPEYFSESLNEILGVIPQYCNIKSGYKICPLKKSIENKYNLIIGDITFDTHSIVTSQLKDSDNAAVFLCTIGDGLETWSKQKMNEGDPFLAYLIDTVASNLVESLANYVHDYIKVEMKKVGLNITNRYSPGYCKWSVSEQKLLFSLLPKNFCNVWLTDSALMLPIKSISGIIGIGKNAKYNDYLCDVCGIKDCTVRQKRIK